MNRNEWSLSAESVSLVRPAVPGAVITIPAEPQILTLDLGRTAVMVIDMQNDFCHEDGWLAGIGVDISPVREIIPRLALGIPALRDCGVPVLWVNWGNRADAADLPPGVRHVYDPAGEGKGIGSPSNRAGSPVLEAGGWSAGLVDELAAVARPEDIRVDKMRMSGFPGTGLDAILRNLRVDTLLFAGVNVDQCVLATLTDAANLGYDVILLTDAAATTSPRFCVDATVYNVRQCYGFTAEVESLVRAVTHRQD